VKHKTTHKENLNALRRIEGQVKGVQKMVEKEKYCIDIVNQIHAVVNAMYRVSEKILAKHIEGCVAETFVRKGRQEKNQKINELMSVIKRLHKIR
jgi:CsoR family transcriptional regulator, copper-sensing transcriptional repressor